MPQVIEASKRVLIRIGHPAYSGDNAMKYARSKAAAVRELRARGVKRDVARIKVNDVLSRLGGYATVCAGAIGNPIEVGNYSDEL